MGLYGGAWVPSCAQDWLTLLLVTDSQRRLELIERNRDCMARHRGLILPLATEEVAHDLEAFRQVLGDDCTTYGPSKREDGRLGRRR